MLVKWQFAALHKWQFAPTWQELREKTSPASTTQRSCIEFDLMVLCWSFFWESTITKRHSISPICRNMTANDFIHTLLFWSCQHVTTTMRQTTVLKQFCMSEVTGDGTCLSERNTSVKPDHVTSVNNSSTLLCQSAASWQSRIYICLHRVWLWTRIYVFQTLMVTLNASSVMCHLQESEWKGGIA